MGSGPPPARSPAWPRTTGSPWEAAFLATLTRYPTPDEARYFADRLAAATPAGRPDRLMDLFWVLVNSTEFSTNH